MKRTQEQKSKRGASSVVAILPGNAAEMNVAVAIGEVDNKPGSG